MSAQAKKFVADPQVAKDNLTGALAKLKSGLENIATPTGIKQHLTFTVRGNLHKYSFRNQILIRMQCPEAHHVGGYHYWINKGRRPIAGAGCRILAPSMWKKKVEVDPSNPDAIAVTDPETAVTTYQIEKLMRSYRTVVVWDITATNDAKGNPYTGPTGGPVNDPVLAGTDEEDEKAAHLDNECRKFARSQGATVVAKDRQGCHGSYTLDTKTIAIGTRKSPIRVCKTSIHETAHFMEHVLGQLGKYDLGELVAESVAYVVLQRYGLDTSEYSFRYIAGWGGDQRMLQQGLAAIQKIATAIIVGIEADDEKVEEK